MRAAIQLSQRIDTSAKRDPDLWARCSKHDFSDNPKNRGRVLVDVAEFIDLVPSRGSEPRVAQPRPAPIRTRRSRVGENVRVGFKNMGRDLVVRCDIEPGWHETANGWVFQESDRVDLPSGHPLRLSAKIVEHTFGQWRRRTAFDGAVARAAEHGSSLEELFPSFIQAEYPISQSVQLVVDSGTCTFIIKWLDSGGDLNDTLPWKQVGRDWVFKDFHSGLYEQPIRLDDGRSSVARPFYIEVEAALHEPPQPTLAPEYAEKTPFASGGLPSLGKRR